MALTNFRPRGDVKANWEAANPIIKEREMCIEWEEAIGVGQPRIKFGKSGSTTHYMDLDYAVLPIKHDTKDGWSSANPVLEKGEMGVEWETTIGEGAVCIKFGDGTTAWNDSEYASTDRLKEIIEPSSDNEALAVGDTLPLIAGKLNNQQEFLKTKLGYDRLDALAAKLSGLSNQDFVGIMDFISEKKFDKSNLYNGLDSDNPNLALSAPMGKSLSTKLGTGNLPTGMSNVVDGLTQLNSNIEMLGTRVLFENNPPYKIGNNLSEIIEKLDGWSIDMRANTFYVGIIFIGVAGYSLSGGSWNIIGCKTSNAYEWQMAIKYSENTGITVTARSKINNIWNSWGNIT